MTTRQNTKMTLYLDPGDPVEAVLIEMLQSRSRKQDVLRRLVKAGFAELLDTAADDPEMVGLDPADGARLRRARREAAMHRFTAPAAMNGGGPPAIDDGPPAPNHAGPPPSVGPDISPGSDEQDEPDTEEMRRCARALLGDN